MKIFTFKIKNQNQGVKPDLKLNGSECKIQKKYIENIENAKFIIN